MKNTAVFVSCIPETNIFEPLYPEARQAEIDKCSNEKVQREKYFVWKLLEAAIKQVLGERIENIHFEKRSDGKWVADKLCFSLSHSDRVVAVALSDRSVGVDIEALRQHRDGLERRILTERETAELSEQDARSAWEYIIRRWTLKESIFKAGDKRIFEPTKIETAEYNVKTEVLEFFEKKYILSFCAHDAQSVKVEIYDLSV